ALIDALVEHGAVRVEAEPQNAEAAQRVAALLPKFGYFLPRGQADFDGADQLRNIVGGAFFGGRRIESPENSVDMISAAIRRAGAQTFAQLFRARRAGEESVEQGAQVQ